MHIAVAGNIGSGKSALTELLAKHYKWKASYEDVTENPYLEDFYNDMREWAFKLQIYYLKSRFKQTVEIRKKGKTVIQDKSIYEDAYIFAPNLHSMGLMSSRDYENYIELFELMNSLIQVPDLLIYLRADIGTLANQIQKRGRVFEKNIQLSYLKNLNDRYESWIENYSHGKLLIIDVNQLDFIDNPKDLGHVIEKIDAEIHGLF